MHHRSIVERENVRNLPEVGTHDDVGLEDADGRELLVGWKRLSPLLVRIVRIRRDPVVGDVVPVEEAPHVGAGRVPPMTDDDRPARRPVDGEPGQAPGALDPVGGQFPDLRRHVRGHRGDRVVVAGVEAHDARRLRRAEPDGEDRAERDRHLAEHVPGRARPDDALDAVDVLDRLDTSLDEPEERLLAPLVRRILADGERDVGGRAREPLVLTRVEPREDRDRGDLVRGHHADGTRCVSSVHARNLSGRVQSSGP